MTQEEAQTNVEKIGVKIMDVALLLTDEELLDLGTVLTGLGAHILYELIGDDEDEAYARIDEALYDSDSMIPMIEQFMIVRKNKEMAMKSSKQTDTEVQ